MLNDAEMSLACLAGYGRGAPSLPRCSGVDLAGVRVPNAAQESALSPVEPSLRATLVLSVAQQHVGSVRVTCWPSARVSALAVFEPYASTEDRKMVRERHCVNPCGGDAGCGGLLCTRRSGIIRYLAPPPFLVPKLAWGVHI